jgi:hypothetical protein
MPSGAAGAPAQAAQPRHLAPAQHRRCLDATGLRSVLLGMTADQDQFATWRQETQERLCRLDHDGLLLYTYDRFRPAVRAGYHWRYVSWPGRWWITQRFVTCTAGPSAVQRCVAPVMRSHRAHGSRKRSSTTCCATLPASFHQHMGRETWTKGVQTLRLPAVLHLSCLMRTAVGMRLPEGSWRLDQSRSSLPGARLSFARVTQVTACT